MNPRLPKELHMRSGKVPPSPCPSCGKVLDGATGVGEERGIKPEPGAITICGYCAAVLVFGGGLKLRKMDPTEAEHVLKTNPVAKIILNAIKQKIAGVSS
jgi:hypothetical protein